MVELAESASDASHYIHHYFIHHYFAPILGWASARYRQKPASERGETANRLQKASSKWSLMKSRQKFYLLITSTSTLQAFSKSNWFELSTWKNYVDMQSN